MKYLPNLPVRLRTLSNIKERNDLSLFKQCVLIHYSRVVYCIINSVYTVTATQNIQTKSEDKSRKERGGGAGAEKVLYINKINFSETWYLTNLV
jgi:hypothetical protein